MALLENVRFHAGGGERTTRRFAQGSSPKLGDVFVNDAFGTAHRAHASTAGRRRDLPQAVAGFLMEKELDLSPRRAGKPRAPLRRHPRRREGQRQDHGHQPPARQGRHDHHRRRHGLHLPQARAGHQDRQTASTSPKGGHRAKAALDKAKAQGREIPHARGCTHRRRTSTSTRRQRRQASYTAPSEDIPDGWEGVDIGPESVKLFAAEIAEREDHHLERPDGRLRDQGIRQGHHRHRRSDRRQHRRQDHHRRRRQRESREAGRRRRQGDLHLHRRRRLASNSSKAKPSPASPPSTTNKRRTESGNFAK